MRYVISDDLVDVNGAGAASDDGGVAAADLVVEDDEEVGTGTREGIEIRCER